MSLSRDGSPSTLSAMRWHNAAPVRHPPGFVAPCLPTNGRTVPTGSLWAYEIKHDGYRFICRRRPALDQSARVRATKEKSFHRQR